ncbi:uncharacterized protein LOC117327774 [Pecten maximus]|uniref:uncharacterized protein LOC117327774 n=1 Tax=Pecten maximus TaxID=6579 RepID=UPI0014581A57|nr:uncharacterized protein LOC117327774 [Pecten maximus]XP_033740834.1 uncharacterized protein LOC117327774 [Pecten maximus]XP_033740835.1 uncharacterized protein LOC117327774 [Pecten maximus]
MLRMDGHLAKDHNYSVKLEISPNENTPQHFEMFDNVITSFLREHGIPGASMAITLHGKPVYMQGYGTAGPGKLVLSNSKFRLASISKPITAIVTMKLFQSGLLSLNDTIFGAKGITGYKPSSKGDRRLTKITVEHLLQHSSGWDRDRVGDPVFWNLEKVCPGHEPTAKETLLYYMMSRKLQFSPGKRHSYSNLGYLVLGIALEKKLRMKYEDLVHECLGDVTRNTMYVGTAKKSVEDFQEVEYYNNREPSMAPSVFPGEGLVTPQYGSFPMEDTGSYGGWVSSAGHLLSLFDRLTGNDSSIFILRPDTFKRMVQRPTYENGNDWYGFGLDVQDGGHSWGHTGAMEGTSTTFLHHKSGLSWVLLLNSWSRDMDLDGLVKFALTHVSDLPLWNPVMLSLTEVRGDNFYKIESKLQIVCVLVLYRELITHIRDLTDKGYWITALNMFEHHHQLYFNIVWRENKDNIFWKVNLYTDDDPQLYKDFPEECETDLCVDILDTCYFKGKFQYIFVCKKKNTFIKQILSFQLPGQIHLEHLSDLKKVNYDIKVQSVSVKLGDIFVSSVFFHNGGQHCTTISWLQITPDNFVYELSKKLSLGTFGLAYVKFYTDGDLPSVSMILTTEEPLLCHQRHDVSRFGFLYELHQSADVPIQFLCGYKSEDILNFAAVWEANKNVGK